MKKTPLALLLLTIMLLGVLMIVGCGSSASSTTTTGAATTASSATTTTAASTTTESATTTSAAGGPTTTAAAGGLPGSIVVQMTGADEVPAVQTQATGTLTLAISMGSSVTVNYKLEVSNITDATAAHIHLGAKGQNGEVIYPLFTGPQKSGPFTGVLAEGSLTEANLTGSFKGKTFADLVSAVLSGGTYVNVHTAANPSGEIRGQIILDLGALGGAPTTGGTGTTAASGTTASTANTY